MSFPYQHIPALDNPFLDSMQWGQLVKTLEQMMWSIEHKPMSSTSRVKLKQSILEAQQNVRKRLHLAPHTNDPDFWDRMRGAECDVIGTSLFGSVLGSARDGSGIQAKVQSEAGDERTACYQGHELRIKFSAALLKGV